MNWKYIAGYLDGEGSLIIGIKQDSRRDWRSQVDHYNITPAIAISSYDHEVLAKMRDFAEDQELRVGLYDKKQREGRTDHAKIFRIGGFDNMADFIEKVKPHCIAKKKQLEIFLEIRELWHNRPKQEDTIGRMQKTWTKEIWLSIMKKVDEISELKSRSAGKDWYPFFCERWDMGDEDIVRHL